MSIFSRLLMTAISLSMISAGQVEAQSPTIGLEDQLRQAKVELLVREARRRGDPRRGAMIFHTSAAGCNKCHATGSDHSPLGPDLSTLGKDVRDSYIIESLLYPSRVIRKGYETVTLAMTDGRFSSGIIVRENSERLVLRDISNLSREISVRKSDIERRMIADKSMMPENLISTLKSPREFLDLASYLMHISREGPESAARLQPSANQLASFDDTRNLDHAGIIRNLKQRDREIGERIYRGLCSNCHGKDGNSPSLKTARAFSRDKLKFGADPYQMFLTLSRGNGLMAPTLHLSPRERYQVIHFIREKFMKGNSSDYRPITEQYLATLPKGTNKGDVAIPAERDFGPALASQLGRDVTSALTINLGDITIFYNLHSMDLAGIWRGGFLDLHNTQHMRRRGEGVPAPRGTRLPGLDGWKWAHGGKLDYPDAQLLPRGPLPENWLQYHGHFLYEDQVVLSYRVDGREILELPAQLDSGRQPVPTIIRRTLQIGPGRQLQLATAGSPVDLPDVAGVVPVESVASTRSSARSPEPQSATNRFWLASIASEGRVDESLAVVGQLGTHNNQNAKLGTHVVCAVTGDTDGLTWLIDEQHRTVLQIPADTKTRLIEIVAASQSGTDSLQSFLAATSPRDRSIASLSGMTRGGSLRWPEILTTTGYLGFEPGAYAVDTISIPERTPWNTWFRSSALDFFPDGRMAVATHGGDVWIVSGIDDNLMQLKWKRFAAGLYEPFGIRIVDGLVYVTCRDRLTRLHDLNHDGEADFYESFSADTDVSSFFHAFNFDLQTDSQGNFYYAKAGQYTSYALPGAVIKVSADGKHREVYCTGFRTPNGMGIYPDDRLTASDNQGNWMPASKISLLKQDGFYGYVQTFARNKLWAPDGGQIDHTQVVAPTSFDRPMIWMPQHVDNSSGGQIWVDDPRWGPLSGRMLHTSFGKGWLFYLMRQDVGDVSQAAMIRLPHNFMTGIMRGRVNPADGQVYVTGLDGWNGNGRYGLLDKGIQRVRYTGKPHRMVTDGQIEHDGLRLTFNFPLERTSGSDADSYVIRQWNYKWQSNYGSDTYHPQTGMPGMEDVTADSATVSRDGQSVKLKIAGIRPVDQLHLRLNVKQESGSDFREEIYWTINRIPMEK